MAGEEHLMCSYQLLKKKIHEANDDEIAKETERFKAMCFLFRLDKV